MPASSPAGDTARVKPGRPPADGATTDGAIPGDVTPDGAIPGDVTSPAAGGTWSWRDATVLAIGAVTVAGLGLRLLLLTRPGFLTSGTVEYDDGVYLGAAVRLLEGALPYRDFAYVQPPGVMVIALPLALVAKVVSAPAGLAAARVATACASAACVPLAGRLIRHKGILATLVTCGFLALYPADALTARTLLLEPWMNLWCLLGVNAAFARGRLASPRRLVWAGLALGFATAIKFWAAVPAVVLLGCLLARDGRWRRSRGYLAALTASFAVSVVPFAAVAPAAFVHSTVADQISRMGAATPMTARLAYVTGLIPLLGRAGQLSLAVGAHSALAMGSNGTMVINGIGRAPYAVAVLGCAVLAAGYLRRPARRSPLDWFALATAAASATAITSYSAFFYHYPAFPAPWLALSLGAAAGTAAGAPVPAAGKRLAVAGLAVLIGVIAVGEGREIAVQTVPPSPAAAAAVIPAGSCVVADQVSFLVASARVPAPGSGCPDILDSLAETLTLSGGISVPGGAGNDPRVIAGWESVLSRARYVWLSDDYQARIPWTAALNSWFGAHFRPVRAFPGYGGSTLYERTVLSGGAQRLEQLRGASQVLRKERGVPPENH